MAANSNLDDEHVDGDPCTDPDHYLARSRPLDLDGIVWADVPKYVLTTDAIRILRYMQDIECHTIVYLRELLATRAIDDPEVATFLACWFAEETSHGRALARFLAEAGHSVVSRARSQQSASQRVEASLIAATSRVWPSFAALHMTWGAINELTALTGYKRLAEVADHPVLTQLLTRIVRDESRHFSFYFRQASQRLRKPGVSRVARFLVERFWAPVGSGVQPAEETIFLGERLFAGSSGRTAVRRIDSTIEGLPGFGGLRLVERWVDKNCGDSTAMN